MSTTGKQSSSNKTIESEPRADSNADSVGFLPQEVLANYTPPGAMQVVGDVELYSGLGGNLAYYANRDVEIAARRMGVTTAKLVATVQNRLASEEAGRVKAIADGTLHQPNFHRTHMDIKTFQQGTVNHIAEYNDVIDNVVHSLNFRLQYVANASVPPSQATSMALFSAIDNNISLRTVVTQRRVLPERMFCMAAHGSDFIDATHYAFAGANSQAYSLCNRHYRAAERASEMDRKLRDTINDDIIRRFVAHYFYGYTIDSVYVLSMSEDSSILVPREAYSSSVTGVVVRCDNCHSPQNICDRPPADPNDFYRGILLCYAFCLYNVDDYCLIENASSEKVHNTLVTHSFPTGTRALALGVLFDFLYCETLDFSSFTGLGHIATAMDMAYYVLAQVQAHSDLHYFDERSVTEFLSEPACANVGDILTLFYESYCDAEGAFKADQYISERLQGDFDYDNFKFRDYYLFDTVFSQTDIFGRTLPPHQFNDSYIPSAESKKIVVHPVIMAESEDSKSSERCLYHLGSVVGGTKPFRVRLPGSYYCSLHNRAVPAKCSTACGLIPNHVYLDVAVNDTFGFTCASVLGYCSACVGPHALHGANRASLSRVIGRNSQLSSRSHTIGTTSPACSLTWISGRTEKYLSFRDFLLLAAADDVLERRPDIHNCLRSMDSEFTAPQWLVQQLPPAYNSITEWYNDVYGINSGTSEEKTFALYARQKGLTRLTCTDANELRAAKRSTAQVRGYRPLDMSDIVNELRSQTRSCVTYGTSYHVPIADHKTDEQSVDWQNRVRGGLSSSCDCAALRSFKSDLTARLTRFGCGSCIKSVRTFRLPSESTTARYWLSDTRITPYRRKDQEFTVAWVIQKALPINPALTAPFLAAHCSWINMCLGDRGIPSDQIFMFLEGSSLFIMCEKDDRKDLATWYTSMCEHRGPDRFLKNDKKTRRVLDDSKYLKWQRPKRIVRNATTGTVFNEYPFVPLWPMTADAVVAQAGCFDGESLISYSGDLLYVEHRPSSLFDVWG
jgi:hypothetical protein